MMNLGPDKLITRKINTIKLREIKGTTTSNLNTRNLHRIPSVSRGFDSPTPCDHQTLVGFLSPKVFLRILQDFFVLHSSIPVDDFLCPVVPLGCLSPNLSLA
jgi:hypothetical protein